MPYSDAAIRRTLLILAPLLAAACTGAPELDVEGATITDTEPTIRIGVVPAASSVSIGSAGNFDVQTGATLLHGSNATATVTLQSGSTTTSNYRAQVVCGNAMTVATDKAIAEAAGFVTFTQLNGSCTRLYVGSLPPNATAAQRTALQTAVRAITPAFSGAFVTLVTITIGSTVYHVQLGATGVDSDSPVRLKSDTLVTINGARYRGLAEVTRNSAGTLAGVNELPMEQYLYGVVPSELSPKLWPQLEAQKAQAVAARSYAMRNLGKRAADGYDLLATTADQVYGGYASEQPISNAAVDATRGIVPTFGGLPIDALFFSTSGGYTADNEDVFSSAAIAYLRGVRDHEHGDSDAVLDDGHHDVNPQTLRGAMDGDFEATQSTHHRWTVTWTAAQMSEVITDYAKSLPAGFAGSSVGKVLAIDVVDRSNSGRVKTINYVTEAGTFTDSKDHVRTSLKFFNDSGVKTSLWSTLFVLDAQSDPQTKEPVSFTAWGGGFGHGVGMCQTGAAGMADHGYTYDQILQSYYQQIALTQKY